MSEPGQHRRSYAGALVGALVVLLVVVGIVVQRRSAVEAEPSVSPSAVVSALASPTGFYVDPDSPAAVQQREWAAQGRTDDARRIGEIAAQPLPEWFTQPTGSVGAAVDAYVSRAEAVGQRPLLVTYYVPGRDCGSYSGGGAKDDADYRAWIREFAAGLKGRAATVVMEPDAVAHEVTSCGAVDGRATLLSDAVQVVKAAGPVTVYLDGGNPGFVADVGALAAALERSGVARADGFSLNVANFYRTDQVEAYGRKVSDVLQGKHFVVDTGRNGNGRYPGGDQVNGGPAFCNPPGRAIGAVPTTDTGHDRVDAYLWIKRVGASDGACRPGEPAAGQWWPDYALALVPA